jgi:ribosomal protein S30
MDTTKFKSVSIDIETYDILAKVAEHECRSIGGQIQWLIKQMPMLADLKPMTPAVPVKRKKKEVPHRRAMRLQENYTSKILAKFAQTRATMCKDDFTDIALECDPSKIMSTLRARGDLELVSRTRPYYYHITLQGIRSYNAVVARRLAS